MSENIYKHPFPYDAFCIIVLLVVACGSILVALSQVEAIIYFSNRFSFLLFTTVVSLSLVSAILAAFFKHQQNECKSKSEQSAEKIRQLEERGSDDEKIEKAIILLKRDVHKKHLSGNKFSRLSGWAVKGSLLNIIIGFLIILGAFWYQPVMEMLEDSAAMQDSSEMVDEELSEEEE